MKRSELKQLVKEELNNYMFFQNLKTIKRTVDELLKMDANMVNMVLNDMHDWANDHIATSKDDIEEVYNFLINYKNSNLNEKIEFTQKYNDNPKLKGKQKNLPDNIQKLIIKTHSR
jgi:hypothetical protein